MFGPWRLAIWGTFTGGTVVMQVSTDGGTTWVEYYTEEANVAVALSAAGVIAENCRLPALVQFACKGLSTGTVEYSLTNVWGGARRGRAVSARNSSGSAGYPPGVVTVLQEGT